MNEPINDEDGEDSNKSLLTEDEQDYIDWLNSIEVVDSDGNIVRDEPSPPKDDQEDIDEE